MKFIGTIEELQARLAVLQDAGQWHKLNDNQYQFKAKSGGVLNWYPSTGSIIFQGKAVPLADLERIVADLLSPVPDAHPDGEQEAPEETIQKIAQEKELQNFSYLDNSYSDSELVIGLVGSVGTDLKAVAGLLRDRLLVCKYSVEDIKISSDVISMLGDAPAADDHYGRIDGYMKEGNRLRKESGDFSILALGAASRIKQIRENGEGPSRKAYIINSLKSPDEVQRLRQIYAGGFFLIGVHADYERRFNYLTQDLKIESQNAISLISRDANESDGHGQHTRDTYHLSDFFINYDGSADSLKMQVWRVISLLFGNPFVTPTVDEYSMFMAFSSSLRSADLSRQVGAVLSKGDSIIASGANDVPKAGGGLYWPYVNDKQEIVDQEDGRDYKRGEDSNAVQKKNIIDKIVSSVSAECREEVRAAVERSPLKDITEYGRVVHAEMETLLSAARSGISTVGATLYCTTFPCHNCAKHIIASGIQRVVYVEPYPKSKAQEFHSDAICTTNDGSKVLFSPFIGVGPRRFFDLFSTNLGSGYPITRKTPEGQAVDWDESTAKLRTQMLPISYLDREIIAESILSGYLGGQS